MTDIDVDIPVDDDTEEETDTEAEEAKSKKKPLPDGCVTPTGLTNHLNEKYGSQEGWQELKPQQMYGWHKNGKGFPRWTDEEGEEHGTNPADGRYIVPLDEGETWVLNQIAAAKERKAKRAAKAKAEAEAEATEDDDAPEVEFDSIEDV